jgi:hypothetical protein
VNVVGAVPHQYNYRRCRCWQCQTIGYHQSGRVVRFLAPQGTGSISGYAFGWGYDYDWDRGTSICLKCRLPLSGRPLRFSPTCSCTPIWALQAGIAA